MILTDSEIDDLSKAERRAFCEHANNITGGPPIMTVERAHLIAVAHRALPSLLAEVKAARKVVDEARLFSGPSLGHHDDCDDCRLREALAEYDALAKETP